MNSFKWFKIFSAFIVPATIVGAIFPFIIFTKTNEAIMGLDWIINGFTGNNTNSWIDPFYRIFYDNYTRYSDLFIANPDLPYFYAGIKRVLSYYLINPFQTSFGPNLSLFSHSPILLFIGIIFPIYVIFSKKTDHISKLLALILSFGYVLKIVSYPLLDPPKSEVFQLLPATILLSAFLNKWWCADIIKKGENCIVGPREQCEQISRKKKIVLTAAMIVLLPLVYMNAYRMKDVYADIKFNIFASTEAMADRFNQKWYKDNLSDKDVLFGRRPNEICYIEKPKIVPFFWEAMYFIPWEVIERRINDLNVTVIYDPSLSPNIIRSRYEKIMPIIKQRDKSLFDKLEKIFVVYERNYVKKSIFLSIYYERVGADDVGQIYRRKQK